MNLLLDTHVVLWWSDGRRVADDVAAAVAEPANRVLVSAASVWEAAIKVAAGKLDLQTPMRVMVDAQGFDHLPITADHGERAGGLPLHHRDPFDRVLVAQAQLEGLTLVSHDRRFAAYDVELLLC